MLYTKKLALTTKMKFVIQQQQQNCLIMHTNHIYAKTTTIFNKFPFTAVVIAVVTFIYCFYLTNFILYFYF